MPQGIYNLLHKQINKRDTLNCGLWSPRADFSLHMNKINIKLNV